MKYSGSVTFLAGMSTSARVSNTTTEAMSSGPSRPMAMIAASRAWAILSPAMEPDRSMTNATLTGVRLSFGSGLQPCQRSRR